MPRQFAGRPDRLWRDLCEMRTAIDQGWHWICAETTSVWMTIDALVLQTLPFSRLCWHRAGFCSASKTNAASCHFFSPCSNAKKHAERPRSSDSGGPHAGNHPTVARPCSTRAGNKHTAAWSVLLLRVTKRHSRGGPSRIPFHAPLHRFFLGCQFFLEHLRHGHA